MIGSVFNQWHNVCDNSLIYSRLKFKVHTTRTAPMDTGECVPSFTELSQIAVVNKSRSF